MLTHAHEDAGAFQIADIVLSDPAGGKRLLTAERLALERVRPAIIGPTFPLKPSVNQRSTVAWRSRVEGFTRCHHVLRERVSHGRVRDEALVDVQACQQMWIFEHRALGALVGQRQNEWQRGVV